jgi:hypothetical protein
MVVMVAPVEVVDDCEMASASATETGSDGVELLDQHRRDKELTADDRKSSRFEVVADGNGNDAEADAYQTDNPEHSGVAGQEVDRTWCEAGEGASDSVTHTYSLFTGL